jgi:hypothetical protein
MLGKWNSILFDPVIPLDDRTRILVEPHLSRLFRHGPAQPSLGGAGDIACTIIVQF